MGDTYLIRERVFCGHAVERTIYSRGAVAIDTASAPEGKAGPTLVPGFWGEPQDDLQMAPAVSGGRTPRFEESFAATATNAAAIGPAHGQANRALARAGSGLGGEEDSRSLDRSCKLDPDGTDDCALAPAVAMHASGASATAQGLCPPRARADAVPGCQSRVDRGLQGLVSDGQWPTLRTVDGAGFVQP